MAKPGPRPTPEAILVARGSDVPQRRRAAGKAAPVPVAATVEALQLTGPDVAPTLDQARAVVCRALDDAGVFGKGQELPADVLARAVVNYHTARERLAAFQDAHPVEDIGAVEMGTIVYGESVYVNAMGRAETALIKLCREFGLTPASVSEVAKPPAKPVADETKPAKAPIMRGRI